jgi:hypothetical protein
MDGFEGLHWRVIGAVSRVCANESASGEFIVGAVCSNDAIGASHWRNCPETAMPATPFQWRKKGRRMHTAGCRIRNEVET